MSWHSIAELLHMGGYAVFVWGSVAATALVAVVEVAMLRRYRRTVLQKIRQESALDGLAVSDAQPAHPVARME